MNQSGFSKLYWGFLFELIDFRINGFDIFPNVVGYILFFVGFGILAQNSLYFVKARNLSIPMIILSLFSIYEKTGQESGIQLGDLGILSIPVAIVSIVLSIFVVYNLFRGIKEMSENQVQMDLYSEADDRCRQYLILQVAAISVFVLILIPALAVVFIILIYILTIVITVRIMQFMKRCGERL